MSAAADHLADFLAVHSPPPRQLHVPERPPTDVVPFAAQLRRVVDAGFTNVTVTQDSAIARDAEKTVVVTDAAGTPLARTGWDTLVESYFTLNSDSFMTGSTTLAEFDFPAVFERFEPRFSLRGYPDHPNQKLVLLLVSRAIEQRALRRGHGRLHAFLQPLDRFDDETGTRSVYRDIADAGVDVYCHGVGPLPQTPHDVTFDAGRTDEHRRSWVVVYRPDDPGEPGGALVAIERERGTNEWRGCWTFQRDLVDAVDDYLTPG